MADALWLRNIYDGNFTNLMRLDFWDAVAFGPCNAATGSLIDVTETNRDINIPDGLDRGNVVSLESTIRNGGTQVIWRHSTALTSHAENGRRHPAQVMSLSRTRT